jgi:hypothetical protein
MYKLFALVAAKVYFDKEHTRGDMLVKLPEKAIKIMEGKNWGDIATLMPDRSPRISTTWVDHDGDTTSRRQ